MTILLSQLSIQAAAAQVCSSLALFSLDALTPQTIALGALAGAAFGMLVLVTGGIAYLTAVEWRDRRRRDRDRRSG
ncbi:MAG: hypothetical protein ACFB5Z_19135 [Elainellaceae cyanobacterium]